MSDTQIYKQITVCTEYQAVASAKCVESVTPKARGGKLQTHTPLGTFWASPFTLHADSQEQLLSQKPSCKHC